MSVSLRLLGRAASPPAIERDREVLGDHVAVTKDDDEVDLVLDSVEIAPPATDDVEARQVKKRLSGQGMQLLNEALASGKQTHK